VELMPTTYGLADRYDIVRQILSDTMERWHQPLHEAEVRVAILWAENEDGPAIKRGGDPVAAQIQVLALKWRVLTDHDALLTIDKNVWDSLDQASQIALVDHELSHLELAKFTKIEGASIRFDRDDIGRPKLTTVPGDWASSDGFRHVVVRHGSAAVEAISVRRTEAIVRAAQGEYLANLQAEIDAAEAEAAAGESA
jgi:hypothetical protein